MGGGAMIRTVTAAVGAAPSTPRRTTTTTSNNLPTLPSSSSSNSRFLASGNFTAPFRRHCANRLCHGGVCRCEYVGGRQGERANESFINRVFGPTPSRFEVENAIAALQRWMKIFTSVYLFIFFVFACSFADFFSNLWRPWINSLTNISFSLPNWHIEVCWTENFSCSWIFHKFNCACQWIFVLSLVGPFTFCWWFISQYFRDECIWWNCILPSVLHGISSSGSESDKRIMETQRYGRIYEAFGLLQTDPSVQVPFNTLEGFIGGLYLTLNLLEVFFLNWMIVTCVGKWLRICSSLWGID